jgi:enoyl-[acyl-carrier-protein] reductase (NADH)
VLQDWIETTARERGITYEDQLAEHVHAMALRRIATEDEVASAVLFFASDMSSGITGATLDVNAGQLFQ